ncbi:unnamed protein product [Jaminaea pallidilutea]
MAPSKSQGGKMLSLINYRLRVTLNDGRQMTGQMLAFDPHMNLVLADTEEFRRLKRSGKKGGKKAKSAGAGDDMDEDDDDADDDDGDSATAPMPSAQQKRTLGLIILRGETIVSLTVEGPPPAEKTAAGTAGAPPPGPGRGLPAGRGIGLAAPPGMGGPPGMAARPMPYGRPPMPHGMPSGPPPGMPGGPPPGFPSGPPPGFPGAAGFRPPPPGGYGMPPPRPQ